MLKSDYTMTQAEKHVLEKYSRNKRRAVNKNIPKIYKDGDYFSEEGVEGIYKDDGVIIEVNDEPKDEQLDQKEWGHLALRHSLAISSIVKVKEVKASTFFNKPKLSHLAVYLEKNNSNVVFVNTTLTITQKRNLEIYLNSYVSENFERIRRHNLKSAEKFGDATETHSEFSGASGPEDNNENIVKLRVLDRFDVILSIFASRAQSQISKYQLELAYLKSAKSRVNRGGNGLSTSFLTSFSDFDPSTFIKEGIVSEKEVVSAKQSGTKGTMGGSGEKQIELEKRLIANRETLLKEKLTEATKIRNKDILQRKERNLVFPTVSLIGYTNSGKTAIMNLLSNSDLESRDLLFQTLGTTMKKVSVYRNGSNSFLLLDTVGFISNLPHELVESFKSTLEETFHSDVLLHVVDVSNPMWEFQSKIVYSILDEIYPNKDYKPKIVEVWNKIDLLENLNDLKLKLEVCKFPVVPISALESTNIPALMKQIMTKTNEIFNKKESVIEVPFEKHTKVLDWLKKNVGEPSAIKYSDDGDRVSIKIAMNESQTSMYMENFVILRDKKKK